MKRNFTNRVYGFAIIKALNSNYNADFSGQPRSLPNGKVYATDKTLKYAIRNYWKQALNETIFYFKSINENMCPRTLDETYDLYFGKSKGKTSGKDRLQVLKNLLSMLDVRLFGGTYAGSTNISIHGTCQITPGVNRYPEDLIYTEQILSPFRNSGKKSVDDTMTTNGQQFRLEEGHYVHHFSINPKAIEDDAKRVGVSGLSEDDIMKLKEGLRKGVTYYDSAAKSGSENELLFWLQLKDGSTYTLPSFVQMVDIHLDGTIDLQNVSNYLQRPEVVAEIDHIEIYYDEELTKVENIPVGAHVYPL